MCQSSGGRIDSFMERDANLDRYGLDPRHLGRILTSEPDVKGIGTEVSY